VKFVVYLARPLVSFTAKSPHSTIGLFPPEAQHAGLTKTRDSMTTSNGNTEQQPDPYDVFEHVQLLSYVLETRYQGRLQIEGGSSGPYATAFAIRVAAVAQRQGQDLAGAMDVAVRLAVERMQRRVSDQRHPTPSGSFTLARDDLFGVDAVAAPETNSTSR
jgi:hypothetical protein